MSSGDVVTLVLVMVVAVVAPALSEVGKRFGAPSIVLEILLGILIGPAVLGWARPDPLVTGLSDMGLAFLMFLAGYEIRPERIMGTPLNRAALGWVVSLALGLVTAFILVTSGFALDKIVIGLVLTTTALGTLLPMIRDAGVLETRSGIYILAIGAVGEFGPIMAVAILLSGKDPVATALFLVLFTAISAALALLASHSHAPPIVRMLRRNLNTSTQLPVRIAVLLILLLIFVASQLGLDVLLGAFASGLIVRLFIAGPESEAIQGKLEAIGFGFLVPIFFVVSGMKFDLHALFHPATTLLRIPIFLALFLVVRGVPAMLFYRRDTDLRGRFALALFSATGLPLIVVITTIGVATGRMLPQNAAALVGAGMLSVLIFPLTGLRLLRPAILAAQARAVRAPVGAGDRGETAGG